MSLFLIFVSLLAGILTVLAPCVLPLLPIIIGSISTSKDKKRIYLILASLVISLTTFSLLLKGSTLLIQVDQQVWKNISGFIILIFGLIYIFPTIWENIQSSIGLRDKSDKLLNQSGDGESPISAILIGLSLGPVFASCSPTYSLILATILPASFINGLIYVLIYCFGLALSLYFIGLFGRKLTSKLRSVSNPNGWFKKTLGALFIIVGIMIIFSIDKKIEAYILQTPYLEPILNLENSLLKKR